MRIEHPDLEDVEEGPGPDRSGPVSSTPRGRLTTLRRALKNFSRHNMTNVAAALAYYAFLAIPASLMVAVGLFSLLAGPHAVATLIGKLGGVVPGQARELLSSNLTDTTRHRGSGITVIAVGSLFALWSVTGAMQHLSWALNIAYGQEERRGFVRRRLVALEMALVGLIGAALVFGVLVLGPHLSTWIGNALGAERITKVVWYVAEWPLLVAALLAVFAALTYLGPDCDRRVGRALGLGSLVSVAAWLAASGAFAVYAAHFGSYNKTWGSLAAVVVMLTWLWLGGVALLLGAEIDAVAGEPSGAGTLAPDAARHRGSA